MDKKTPAMLVAALHAYVAEGGELIFEENPSRSVSPVGEVIRVITVRVDAKRYDDAMHV